MRNGTFLIPVLVGAVLATIQVDRAAAQDSVTSAPNSAVQSAVRDARDAALRTQRVQPQPRWHAAGRHARNHRY